MRRPDDGRTAAGRRRANTHQGPARSAGRDNSERWSIARANAWYDALPWIVGCNFVPSTACNQLEMWQAETFDPATIDRELGWAASLGLNAARVFLHDLLWQHDPDGFARRIDAYLAIAHRHGVRTLFVVFDDCWFPGAALGPQPTPVPGIHNSRWLQSPGRAAVLDRAQWPRLEAYVTGLLQRFGDDDRVLAWDLYNEPGNAFLPLLSQPPLRASFGLAARVVSMQIRNRSLPLVRQTFEWARAAKPGQPLTAGIWFRDRALNRFLAGAADVISFHDYRGAGAVARRIRFLRSFGRPLLCTEWLSRRAGSRIETHLPLFHDERVGCFVWGLVAGRTQTIYAWRDRGGGAEPATWFHDLLRPDGTPYSAEEARVLGYWIRERPAKPSSYAWK